MQKSNLELGDTTGDINGNTVRDTIGDIAGDRTRGLKQKSKKMRIGHQIYNYLYDYTDTGTFSLKEGIGLPNCDFSIMGAYINFKENQVYVILKDQRCNVINKTIHQFVCQMGGPNYHSYRPLYHLRDTLRINAKHWIKKYK